MMADRLFVDKLKRLNRPEAEIPHKVYRPAGHYCSIGKGERHQPKRRVVKSGVKLPMQEHHLRPDHGAGLKGVATMNKSATRTNRCVLGRTVHGLHNPGVISLKIIEVQSASYRGDEDIVRLGDLYAGLNYAITFF